MSGRSFSDCTCPVRGKGTQKSATGHKGPLCINFQALGFGLCAYFWWKTMNRWRNHCAAA